jgi:hypothetical protein
MTSAQRRQSGDMKMSRKMTRVAALSAAMLAMLVTGSGLDLSAGALAKAEARKLPLGRQDPAAKLTGTWVLNRELSKGFAAPGRGRGGAQRPGARFATGNITMAAQRGGGSGDATDLTPEQRAEQAAMRGLQQIDTRITIKASAAEVTFTDTRGEHTYAINDKTATIFMASSPVKVKLKWDKQALKQEFSTTEAKLVQIWSIDSADRLVMTAKVESRTLITPERTAVFDRQ